MAAKDDRALLASEARLPQDVVYRSFDAETVLLNLGTGRYHGLNPTGGRILEVLLEGKGTVQEAADQIAGEYGSAPEEIVADLLPFCRGLAERGLVEFHVPGGE